jgi:hypothetical protein
MAIDHLRDLLGGPNTSDWRLFEWLVAALHAGAPGATVTWGDVIDGREFDVAIRFQSGLHEYLTVVECKDFNKKVPVEKVEAFITKSRGVLAHKAVMASSAGFQSGAIEVAKKHGIKLLTLEEGFKATHPFEVKERIEGVSLHSTRLIGGDDKPCFTFDDFTGHSEYLWNESTITYRGVQAKAIAWLFNRFPNINRDVLTEEEELVLDFPGGAKWNAKFEGPHVIKAISLKRRPVMFAVPNGKTSGLSHHLLERMGVTVKVTDEQGAVLSEARLKEMAFDFQTKLEAGRFYWSPSTGFNYFLEGLSENLASWWLVESYQHGRLISVRFQQNPSTAGFVEVTDAQTLARLKRIVAAFGNDVLMAPK